MEQGAVHGSCYLGNPLEISDHAFISVNMRLENLPIVNTGLPRRAGIGENKAGFDFLRHDGNSLPMDAIEIQVDCAHSAIKRGIVVLASSGNVNDLRFDVL